MRAAWINKPQPPRLCFRVAVRAVEAWLFADAESIALFLGVTRSQIRSQPEMLPDPKQTLVELARKSPRKEIRQDMVPRPDSQQKAGVAAAGAGVIRNGHPSILHLWSARRPAESEMG